MIDPYIFKLQDFIVSYNYLLLFAVLLMEASPLGIFAPGLLILVLSGYYAGIGELNVFGVLGVGILGAVCGDVLGFNIGRFGVVKISFLNKYFSHLEKLKNKIQKRKNLIIYAHLPGYTRAVVPMLMGLSRFPFRAWIWRDILGVVLFVGLYGGIGFVIGITTKDLEFAVTVTKLIHWIFVAIFCVWVLAALYTLRRTKMSS